MTGPKRRDDFSVAVLREIAQEVRLECSNPDCRAPTHGPSRQKGISNVGVGAHITAAAPGGPRYDGTLTPAERSSAANAVWLRNTCGRLVDNDTTTYTVPVLVQWKKEATERARKALASGGRDTSVALIASQLEVQRQVLEHQKQSHQAQMRDQQRSRFTEMYSQFLKAAKSYADAIEDYSKKMYLAAFQPDRRAREAMRKPIDDAFAAMKGGLHSILLTDANNETRKALRWELVRGRGFEPTIDSISNQKAYAKWIHYHLLRLLDGITRLQDNVREELGHPPRATSEREHTFTEQTIAEAKEQADAVAADIKAQFDRAMRGEQARDRAGAVAMATSGGATGAVDGELGNDRRVRNRIWNVLQVEIFEDDMEDTYAARRGEIARSFVREIWRDVLTRPIDEVPNDFVAAWKLFRDVFMTCPERTFTAIIQHAGGPVDIRQKLDEVLERCGAAYRFRGEVIVSVAAGPGAPSDQEPGGT